MSNKWEMFGPEVTGSLFDIDYDFMARVLDDCDNEKWLACPSCRWHFEEALRIKCEEIDKLKQDIEELKSKNKELSLRTIMTPSYYDLYNVNVEVNKKIKVLEKENKELKDTLELVADSIEEGCDKGVYKLNPDTRIDIHVEETNNVPMTFDRYAIPRIAIMFNNTQTEMERDTAEHECEELHEKIDSLWSVNDELNRKIKALEKENKGFKTALSMCERDINAAINLCNGAVFLSEQAQKKTPWFTNKIEEEK